MLRGILPEDLCQIFHTLTPTHAQKMELLQDWQVKLTYLITTPLTTLAIGLIIGVGIGNYQVIDCELVSESGYCQNLGPADLRRSF